MYSGLVLKSFEVRKIIARHTKVIALEAIMLAYAELVTLMNLRTID